MTGRCARRQAADHLHPSAGLPEVRLKRLVWRLRPQCSRGNRKNIVSAARSSLDARDRGRILQPSLQRERPGASWATSTAASPGSASVSCKIAQQLRLPCHDVRADLGERVPGAVDQAALPRRGAENLLDGADQPKRPRR